MKLLIVADPHWSQHSSIIRKRGEVYSARLENLIKSVSWAEGVAYDHQCNSIIYIGDFFDSCQLNSEEISALHEIWWAPLSHIYITGNHETNTSNLEYSTTDLFKLCPNSTVINQPQLFTVENDTCELAFLPYILERDRKALSEYFPLSNRKRVIFSHNDIKDISYGPFVSQEGFSIDEIHENCQLFLNGHIHHGRAVTDRIINVGNLTGQNFTEDANKFDHCVALLDTETLKVEYFCNPYAFNFYKIDFTRNYSQVDLKNTLANLKPNAVITIKVSESFASQAREFLENFGSAFVHTYRLIVEPELSTIQELQDNGLAQMDHIEQFRLYVRENIGTTSIIEEELYHITGGH